MAIDKTDSFEATYAVDMHCTDCTIDIRSCLGDVKGIEDLVFDVDKKLMKVKGVAAPSAIISALRDCGRDGVIRGTGNPNSAAVSILEHFQKLTNKSLVKGLARIVNVHDNRTLFDINVNGVEKPGLYYASIRSSGDISEGAKNTGEILYEFKEPIDCTRPSDLGPNLYSGARFVSAPVQILDIVGRSFVITSNANQNIADDKDISICGVIARSAGIWENEKEVCACSGKTIWQERKEAIMHNIKF